VLGLTLGWVPLEEYLFFVLQTLLAGLVVLRLLRAWPAAAPRERPRRLWLAPVAALAIPWLAAAGALAAAWKPGTYLGLELVWALPPIALQLALGADVLWRSRRVVALGLVPVTLYLCVADALAIHAGVWSIAPAQSLNVFLGGLPVEEAVFFLLTNALVVFGLALALSPETWAAWQPRWGRRPSSPDLAAPR
jgi:lycopene cyclase domain-containing protein